VQYGLSLLILGKSTINVTSSKVTSIDVPQYESDWYELENEDGDLCSASIVSDADKLALSNICPMLLNAGGMLSLRGEGRVDMLLAGCGIL
jgi:hypothetical protein